LAYGAAPVISTVEQCRQAKEAARTFALVASATRAALVRSLATQIANAHVSVLAANASDVERAEAAGLSAAMVDRLRLTERRLLDLAQSVRDVAELPDPVGETISEVQRPSGIHVRRVRVPLGVIAIIYESRPNVTIDAAALALRTGNAIVLRGGSEARASNEALERCVHAALTEHGLSPNTVQLLASQERSAIRELVRASEYVDLAIPRGGEALIREVTEHATVPVVQHYKGVCHMVLDADASEVTAIELVLNAKVGRPSACNALECLLVVRAGAARLVPPVLGALLSAGCELRGCEATRALFPSCIAAQESDFGHEFLAPVLAVKIVDSLEEATQHIARYGSGHTEAIVSNTPLHVQAFLHGVDAACVVANASTRFHDGGELGLGAEMGIATSRLHWRGPMGLESLTTMKWVVTGSGQVRR
jgi:glutamate-5-semialdehyde dehydrogenase